MEPPDFESVNPNFITGKLPEGCKLCEQGAKMVLLVTGICNKKCFFCPISEEKLHKDVVYANELNATSTEEILVEARSMDALGTGITGGDPLLVLKRTLGYIHALKKEFGERHQIHLYTAQDVKREVWEDLQQTGLDELRIHLPPESWEPLGKYLLEKETTIRDHEGYARLLKECDSMDMSFGIEIPAIPDQGKVIGELILGLDRVGVEFINLNELETSPTNWKEIQKRGYELRGDSIAIIGSEKAAKEANTLVEDELGRSRSISVHYCSAYFKDAIQLRKRLGRRAAKVAKEYEVTTYDSTLVFGVVTPVGSEDFVKFSARVRDSLAGFDVPSNLYHVDSEKKRVEVAAWVLEEVYEDLPGDCAIVEEYPTVDRLEVERRPLKK